MDVLTWQPEEKRTVRIPKTKCRRTVNGEGMKECTMDAWEEARVCANNRLEWKDCVMALCATGQEEVGEVR